ncbi:VWA domain-containing protein [Cryptosporangium phraense]|uniref:VWA domain-containing protein n=1 Tax=Cryptosporangium phraense TaxID=2593070 RepID=A0A545APR7_9ACTN|nr:VWA domain-containing protein [Cryptosporangium phraense]
MKRKPKQLDEEPTEFRPSRSSSGQGRVLTGRGKRDRKGPQLPGSMAPGQTDEEASLVALDPSENGVDLAVRARAREIAARLSLRRPRRDRRLHRGVGDLASLPYRDGSADLDLDRTLDALIGNPDEVDDESGIDRRIIVRERVQTRRSVVLVVDVSGSMKGERIRTAAATVGAVAGELADDDLAVIAFWSDAAVLLPLGRPARPSDLLDLLLSVPARGLTNVGFPLQLAARELARVPARDARVLLLSDCVHNAGPDPRVFAARLPRLDVLLDVGTPPGEHDLDLGRDLARAGRGLVRPLYSHRDVAPALTSIFAS